MEIRQPKITEFGQIAKLYVTSMDLIKHPDLDDMTEEIFLLKLYNLVQSQLSNIFVSVSYEGNVVGFIIGSIGIAGYTNKGKGFCEELHVDNKYISEHIGPKLIKKLISWFDEHNGIKVQEFMVLYSDKKIRRWGNLGYTPHVITFRKGDK